MRKLKNNHTRITLSSPLLTGSMGNQQFNVIVILGPTASGKSKLGVQLAKRFQGIVISADSRQVYRGMNIGTGKVTTKEMASVPHFLLDVASPRGQYSVSRYVHDVHKVLKKINPSVPVFLVGGSPFYIKAVTVPGSFSNVPPNYELRQRLEKMSTTKLGMILNKKNSAWAKTIDRANRRRLIRAIEISSFRSPPARGGVARSDGVVGALPSMRVLKIGIRMRRARLNNKIDRRVDQRMKQGMVAEVRKLHQQGISWRRLDAFGLEYRYISRYLQDQMTRAEMIQQLKTEIHHFAKRQMMWWKRDEDIFWVHGASEAEKKIKQKMKLRAK